MRVLGVFAAALAVAISVLGCSSKDSGNTAAVRAPQVTAAVLPAARYLSLHLRTPIKDGQCPAVSVKIEPLRIQGGTQSGGTSTSFTDLQLKPAMNESPVVHCEGSALTAAVVYGQWRLTVPLPSGVASCDKTVDDRKELSANFEDGHQGCE